MKKFFSVLAAIAVIATAGSVVACATSETEPVIPDTGAAEKDTTIPEETKIEEVKNDETATTVVETSANTDETTMSDSSEGAESADDTDSESSAEVESATVEVLEDSETEEDGSETVTDEEIEIPQTGDKRKIFPAVATFIVSGIALAYCIVRGKKIKKTK